MKKLVALLLIAALGLSACGGKSDAKQNENTKKAVDTGGKEKTESSDWKWDMLQPNNYVSNARGFQNGILSVYDRRDLGGFAFFGDRAANNGKPDISYVRVVAAVSKDQINGVESLDDIESKFLVRDNSMFRSLNEITQADKKEWKIQKKEKVMINGFEFLHVIAELEAFYDDGSKVEYDKDLTGLIPYAEAYFIVVDDEKIGKNVVAIYRGYQNFTSKAVNEKTQRALQQLVESFRKAPAKK